MPHIMQQSICRRLRAEWYMPHVKLPELHSIFDEPANGMGQSVLDNFSMSVSQKHSQVCMIIMYWPTNELLKDYQAAKVTFPSLIETLP